MTVRLEPGRVDVGGVRRTFMLAPAARREAPLLVALHGLGTTGRAMAALTGLATRGPAAGFATVFPDGWNKAWNDGLVQPRPGGVDDSAFLAQLIGRLVSDGVARSGPVFLAGISNGAYFAEHLARHALLPVAGVALVAGSATLTSRQKRPSPAQPGAFLSFVGTADPVVPYDGGLAHRRRRPLLRHLGNRRRGEPRRPVAAAETVAADWAKANGCQAVPAAKQLPSPRGDLGVTRLSWCGDDSNPVVLYRIEGGGHTWPGGPQYLPASFIGPVARHLDATGILLDMAQGVSGVA
jgi:polyhydroxybutyrate depolymerase